MIGNDVIDLTLAHKESNWQRTGFLNKLFSQREQRLILNAEHPEVMVWNLWSQKEAAYKIYNRQTRVRAFIPLQLACYANTSAVGIGFSKVCCYDQVYFTKTEITSNAIKTVAVMQTEDFDRILPLTSEEIIKINGFPYYRAPSGRVRAATKSHHGRFELCLTLSD